MPMGGSSACAFPGSEGIVASPSVSTPRVWDCIPFGYELDMLWLHLRTVQSAVHRFLITESATTHTTKRTKPLALSNAIANMSVPATVMGLLPRMTIRIVDYHAERDRFCSGGKWTKNPPRCFEAFQRFALVEMVLQHAAPHDVALFGDVDEIPRPETIVKLAACHISVPGAGHMIVLRLSLFKYGVHCAEGNTFRLGTRLFRLTWLRQHYGHYKSATPEALGSMSVEFTQLREATRAPTVADAGWHLTSFGEPWELRRKIQTWLHANLFQLESDVTGELLQSKQHAQSLERISRCMRHCLELGGRGAFMPPCSSRFDRNSTPLKGTVVTSMEQFKPGSSTTNTKYRLDLPPLLVTEPGAFPAAWTAHVRPA